MIYLPLPSDFHSGDALTAALRDAGLSGADVSVLGEQLQIAGVRESDKAKVQQVVSGFTPPPPPPDYEAEFRAALEAATTVGGIKAALLGTTRGPGAAARRPSP